MRPLILILLSLLGSLARAEAPKARLSSSIREDRGSTSPFLDRSLNTHIVSFDFSTGSYFADSVFRFGFDQLKNDYSSFEFGGKTAVPLRLSDSYDGREKSFRIGADYFYQVLKLNYEGLRSFDQGPFSGHSGQLLIEYKNQASGTEYFILLGESNQRVPEYYFKDLLALKTLQSPLRNREIRYQVGFEQILSEISKFRGELQITDKLTNRSEVASSEIAYAQALSDSQSVIAKTGAAVESEKVPEAAERGRLSAQWLSVEHRFQPNHRWSYSTQIVSLLETESERGALISQKVGTDSLGLQISYLFKKWQFGFELVGSRSNTEYQSLQMTGDLSWQI